MKKVYVFVVILFSLVFLTSCRTNKYDDHYIVVFYLNGEAHMESTQVPKGGKLARPTDPESEESDFVDWYEDRALTKLFDFNKPIEKSITIYAEWQYIEYTISYELEADAVNDPLNPTSYTSKQNGFRLRAASREGYRFQSWHLKEDLSDSAVQFLSNDIINGDVTLYPKWRKLN